MNDRSLLVNKMIFVHVLSYVSYSQEQHVMCIGIVPHGWLIIVCLIMIPEYQNRELSGGWVGWPELEAMLLGLQPC